jgi:hypothetical protein
MALPPNITAVNPGYRYEIQTVNQSDLQFLQFNETRSVDRARKQGYQLDEADFPDPLQIITINDGITSEDLLAVLIQRHQTLNNIAVLNLDGPAGPPYIHPVPRLQAKFIEHLTQALLCLEVETANANVVTDKA